MWRRSQTGSGNARIDQHHFLPCFVSRLLPSWLSIVHRDLKLDNLLLANTTGQVCMKLTDFGLAAVKAGSNAGSNTYSAPEREKRGKIRILGWYVIARLQCHWNCSLATNLRSSLRCQYRDWKSAQPVLWWSAKRETYHLQTLYVGHYTETDTSEH